MGRQHRRAAWLALVLLVSAAARTSRAQSGPGELKWVPIEELLRGNVPLTSAVRTRGILEVSPRMPGQAYRLYFLTASFDSKEVTVQRRLPIQPVGMAQGLFAFDAETLNMREIEVVGSFQPPQGMGMSMPGSDRVLWFWEYEQVKDEASSEAARKPGQMAIEDLAGRPDTLAKQSLVVVGQFRGRNLFGDLDAGDAPPDGWVIKDGDHAVWVVGKKPKGRGWSLDPESRGDAKKWIEVTGKLERHGEKVWLRAQQIELVAAPKPVEDES
jgi:hypothetical protein